MQDPNPLVAGQGLQRLGAAGIKVESGLLEDEARALNPGFLSRMQRGRPWVRVKLASSLDGRTAMACGESKWITAEPARRDVQRLRARSSAIVTGIGTVHADDPSLNVRLEAQQLMGVEPVRQPLRVVMDTHLAMPRQAKMLSLPGDTLVVTAERDSSRWQALQEAGAEVVAIDAGQRRLEPESVLKLLAERQINEVLLECGARLAGAFLTAKLVDELVLYLAPHLMGDSARGLFHLPALQQMRDRVELEWLDVRQVGDALRITAQPYY
jgi:diaminohydroxyphosphoribosylaminopyrimidine deaminase/5-amino-6-(5-phosphoribosylamino)uracil reductase